MTGDVDADPAAAAAPEPSETPNVLEAVGLALALTTAALGRLGRKLDLDSRAEDASVEKLARATGGLARAAIAVLALDVRVREAVAAAGDPTSGSTEEAEMDDADEVACTTDEAGEADGTAAAAPRAEDPDLAYRLARMAWRLGRGGELPPRPPERAGEAGGALGLPGP